MPCFIVGVVTGQASGLQLLVILKYDYRINPFNQALYIITRLLFLKRYILYSVIRSRLQMFSLH